VHLRSGDFVDLVRGSGNFARSRSSGELLLGFLWVLFFVGKLLVSSILKFIL
jgi:hypothetical protein